ncbi:unnamed protein product [marine sediment metagenome]|uniref:Uncharacterized protein n=1 Tax=marine sediment metagenome TaxID=412755 RepID=X1A7J8_9ZZZZ
MPRKKVENIENESKNEKFKRIANPRIKKLRYELARLNKMASQPNYEIFDVDAQKMLDVIQPEIDSLIELYTKIANNEAVKTATKDEVTDVF